VFFLGKLAYVLLSTAQLRYGFPPAENFASPFLTKEPSFFRSSLFPIYRAIPFLFELRTLLDWMCTRTALNVFETFKLEDIYQMLYVTQVDIVFYRAPRKRGQQQPLWYKTVYGFLYFLFMMVCVFTPL
jgi:hypothetical protein